jgi:hypothetical protein
MDILEVNLSNNYVRKEKKEKKENKNRMIKKKN